MPRRPLTRLRFALPSVLALAVLLLIACGGGEDAALPDPASTATPTVSASQPDADQWDVAVHSADTRSGVDAVDRVIAAAVGGDVDVLVSHMAFRDVACERSETGMHPYECPPGVADGTVVSAVSAAYCEGTFISPDGIDQAIAGGFFRQLGEDHDHPLRLYAVAAIDDDPFESGSAYRVLLAFPDGTGRQLWVNADGITLVWFGCGDTPVNTMTVTSSEGAEPDYLVSPRAG